MEPVRRLQIVCGALAVSVVLMNVVITFLWLSGLLPPKIWRRLSMTLRRPLQQMRR